MMPEHDEMLPAAAAAAAVFDDGWRVLVGGAYSWVSVSSMSAAVDVASAAVRTCGPHAAHLRVDLRPDRVALVVRTPAAVELTQLDVSLTSRISGAVGELGLTTTAVSAGAGRPVQALEIAIDALGISAVLPFWQAAFGYVVATRPIAEGREEVVLVDPAEQGPTVWFQQMSGPRQQRNRVHFDLTVGEDQAELRVAAVLAAGGRMVSDAQARAFWVLADPEGNEVCICTWQDRD